VARLIISDESGQWDFKTAMEEVEHLHLCTSIEYFHSRFGYIQNTTPYMNEVSVKFSVLY